MESSKLLEIIVRSINQGLISLGLLELSIIAWLLPEYSRKYHLGSASNSVSILGVSFGRELGLLSFGFIILILVLILKPVLGLVNNIESGKIKKDDLKNLSELPTILNIFYIPPSTLQSIPNLIQYFFIWSILFMPFCLGIGGYISFPGRGSFISIVGPSVLFGILGSIVTIKLLKVLTYSNRSKIYFSFLLAMLIIALASNTYIYYLFTAPAH